VLPEGAELTDKHKPGSRGYRLESRRVAWRGHKSSCKSASGPLNLVVQIVMLTVCRDESPQIAIPNPTLDKVDQGRKYDQGHHEEEREGEQGVFRSVHRDVHDFDRAAKSGAKYISQGARSDVRVSPCAQEHLVLILERPEDPEQT
jgi:hypothetical protein